MACMRYSTPFRGVTFTGYHAFSCRMGIHAISRRVKTFGGTVNTRDQKLVLKLMILLVPLIIAISLGLTYALIFVTQALFGWPRATDWRTLLLVWFGLWIVGLIVKSWRSKS